MQRPKLRDNKGKGPFELYPIGQIPDEIIYSIGKLIAFNFTTGKPDIDGEDWGDIFTWQPHGSQFTILYDIPVSARKFKIKRPPVLDFEKIMESIGFEHSWVTIL